MRPRVVLACLVAPAACGVFIIWIRPPRPGSVARAVALPSAPGALPTLSRPSVSAPSAATPPVPAPEAPAAPLPSAEDEAALLRRIEEARGEADPARRRELLVAVCLRWADFDPPAAIALALDLKLDPLEGALLPNLAQQWAARDFPAAQDWARRLPDGELRDQVYSRLAYERALSDPAAAAGLLEGMRPGGAERGEAALTVLHFWTMRDPAAAGAWAASEVRAGGTH